MKGLCILGSTGSIGVSALQVVAGHPDRFEVIGLGAGRNMNRLAEQIATFHPELVSVERAEDRERLQGLLRDGGGASPEVLCGESGAATLASDERAALVLTAMVGAVGLRPTLAAIRRGASVAIANKEPLVMAGQLCMKEAAAHGATILPVDSEHNAIFQCLQGHSGKGLRRILLTGSGGPFRTIRDLTGVSLEQALAHPTWTMGKKITIDSATLMNKGLEVIEARWLFGLPPDRIQVVIHPQSIIHSMVEYVDGSILAQLGVPDMCAPIAHALGYPDRLSSDLPALDLAALGQLTFEEPDTERFPCLALAFQAIEDGGTYPAVLNAANEVAVAAFLDQKISYLDIPAIISRTLDAHDHGDASSEDLDVLLEADLWARRDAAERIDGQ